MNTCRFALALLVSIAWIAPVHAQSESTKTQAVFAAGELESRCAAAFRQFERFKETDRLLEMGGSGLVMHVEIVSELHGELGMVLGLYLKAIDDGWPEDDPELATARQTIEQALGRMAECGMWTCFRWEDPPIDFGAIEKFDTIRSRAWNGALLVEAAELDAARDEFAFVDTLIGEVGETIDRALDRGLEVDDWRNHPAYARTLEEVDRLKASVRETLAAQQGERDRLFRDTAELAEVVEMAEPLARAVVNAASFSGTEEAIIERVEAVQRHLDTFESDAAGRIREVMSSFGNRYGADRDAIEASVSRIMNNQALDVPHSPGMLFESLQRNLNDVAEVRADAIKELIAIAERNAATEAIDPARREREYALAKRCLDLVLAMDPENAEATRIRSGLGAAADAAAEQADAVLDQGTWEAHAVGFQGPGDADDLAESARAWLAADTGWSGDKDPIAVRVNGDWVVAERNRDGEPITWGLPIEAAFVTHADRDADRDVARVFRLTMVTRENEKAPPWKMARVGSTRQMRASRIEAPGVGVSGGAAGGGPNMVFQLLLVLALLASGLLLLAPILTTRVAALGPSLNSLSPIRPMVGVGALAIGVILLVFNLLSPFSDLMPQAAAIIAGLFLGLEVLLKKRPVATAPEESGDDLAHKAGRGVDAAVSRAQGFLASHEEDVRKIGKYQAPLGIACVVLALIHLFGANVLFF